MDAKERVLTSMNHNEPDRVPSFEIAIDNLKIYEHYGLKYGYQGSGDLLAKTYDLVKGDTALLKKFIDKSSKVTDTLIPGIELFIKAGIDLHSLYLTNYKGGLKFFLHSCGDIIEIFDDIIDCGVDAIHPIEPTTASLDFNIFKLQEKYGDKITFVGNVSPQDLADKDPQFIQEYVKKLIKEIAPGRGFILSSGHSINPAIKLENFLIMQETPKKFGTYPISF